MYDRCIFLFLRCISRHEARGYAACCSYRMYFLPFFSTLHVFPAIVFILVCISLRLFLSHMYIPAFISLSYVYPCVYFSLTCISLHLFLSYIYSPAFIFFPLHVCPCTFVNIFTCTCPSASVFLPPHACLSKRLPFEFLINMVLMCAVSIGQSTCRGARRGAYQCRDRRRAHNAGDCASDAAAFPQICSAETRGCQVIQGRKAQVLPFS